MNCYHLNQTKKASAVLCMKGTSCYQEGIYFELFFQHWHMADWLGAVQSCPASLFILPLTTRELVVWVQDAAVTKTGSEVHSLTWESIPNTVIFRQWLQRKAQCAARDCFFLLSSPFFFLLFSTPPVFALNTKSLLQGGMLVNYNLFTY